MRREAGQRNGQRNSSCRRRKKRTIRTPIHSATATKKIHIAACTCPSVTQFGSQFSWSPWASPNQNQRSASTTTASGMATRKKNHKRPTLFSMGYVKVLSDSHARGTVYRLLARNRDRPCSRPHTHGKFSDTHRAGLRGEGRATPLIAARTPRTGPRKENLKTQRKPETRATQVSA
jgi:hypothetical protein